MRADVEATRTYLELKYRDQFRAAFGDFPDVVAERVAHATPGLYRHCYRTVGAEYHWRDRWDWSDAEIRAHLARPEISLFVAVRGGALVGWYELRRVAEDDSVEIAYFGLGAVSSCTPGPRCRGATPRASAPATCRSFPRRGGSARLGRVSSRWWRSLARCRRCSTSPCDTTRSRHSSTRPSAGGWRWRTS